ncbi:MAG: CsbD family protein [Thermoanaerobaculia bacterium]
MNIDILSGQWQQLKGEIRETWGKLTDDEVERAQGSAEKLTGLLHEKYGWTKDEAAKRVADLLEKFTSKLDDTAVGRNA